MNPITVYTIGFTQKSAEEFFTTINEAGVERIIDIRRNNTSQLAGFTKMNDLRYFANVICNADYIHMPLLAPTKDMLNNYKADRSLAAWETYERLFIQLMREREIESINMALLSNACLLCSESSPENCHRRLVTEYLAMHSDIRVVNL